MRRHLGIAAAALLCAFALPGHAADSAAEQADACWRKAFLAADVDAVTACYAPDAVLWFPGGPKATGSKGVHDAYAKFFADNKVTNVELKRMGERSMGSDAVGWGEYMLSYVPKGGTAITETGRYTAVMRRVHGHWVYIVDHASSDPAPAGMKP